MVTKSDEPPGTRSTPRKDTQEPNSAWACQNDWVDKPLGIHMVYACMCVNVHMYISICMYLFIYVHSRSILLTYIYEIDETFYRVRDLMNVRGMYLGN